MREESARHWTGVFGVSFDVPWYVQVQVQAPVDSLIWQVPSIVRLLAEIEQVAGQAAATATIIQCFTGGTTYF